MIYLNVICAKLLSSALYAKKEKNLIHVDRLKSKLKIISNNAFIILIIFENIIINKQKNRTIEIIKILIYKNYILSIKKFYSSIEPKVNKPKLILF